MQRSEMALCEVWFVRSRCSGGGGDDTVRGRDEVGDGSNIRLGLKEAVALNLFPLMAKSKKLNEMMVEQEMNRTVDAIELKESEEDEIQEEKMAETEIEEYCHVTLPDFPGGSETFETTAKFCYAVKIELSAFNVAPLRCAGEVLEMTEEYCEDILFPKLRDFSRKRCLEV
ncbi:hypothetical protein L2E82_06566 [Cichorium intybus]|uniref:Uncharacterized protein n=1 Tax=Cichorium intybus TaxID=13427 RepID=A0ACB9HBH4_CICIN|nr:hypothetical protein L2E82_06566 [Cichorium intybus]